MIEPLAVLAVPVPEACRVLSCGRSKFYELVNDREILIIKLGKKSLVPVASLKDLLARKIQEAA